MRTPWSWVLAVSVAGAVSACNGPKETCEGSASSFYSLLKGHDWSALHEMLTPEFRKRWNKVDRFSEAMEAVWLGSKDFSVRWNTIGETRERVCIVNGQLTYTIKIRGQEPRTISDEYFSWTLRLGTDGRWYAELPGQEKISGY